MKKISLLLLVGLLFSPVLLSAAQGELSPSARISLLTATPGDELYSVFGHSALRVRDPETGLDEVYNYGTFDFDTPNFYLKFLRGKLFYKLSVVPHEYFLLEYRYEGRGISEQILNLSQEETRRIYDFLQVNRQPGNEYYLYDFFYDNCATRIRDIVENQLEPDWGEDPVPEYSRSFRDMLKPFLVNKPWALFGVDLVLGLPSDREATPWHYMFLPDEMFLAFSQARHANGRPLIEQYALVLEQTFSPGKSHWLTPLVAAWMVFLLGILSLLKVRIARVFDKIFFTILGLVGLVILFLWFLSDHTATNANLNLLWALPTHLYFIFKGNMIYPIGIPRYYFKVVFFLNLFLLLFWPLLPQGFHPAFLPLILLSAVKVFLYGYGDAWKRLPFMRRRR
ncbi:MAG: DUF4105 domain-containing protein [Bacteroides sp.]|jgi:hypothetical protein|nr:DUF4105 domain-containing protein [Bacteroides sp.]